MKNAQAALTVVLFLVAIALPFLYFGAYYALLCGRQQAVMIGDANENVIVWKNETPLYRWEGEGLHQFFAVAHALDTRLRPHEWEMGRIEIQPSAD